jgi:DNA-binding transcriptional MerR regulator
MTEYKSGDLQQLFKVSSETIRQWAIEFEQYLSPGASPGAGKMRLFSVDDLRVFSLVSDLKNMGKTFDEIHAALKSGQRGEIPVNDSEQSIELRSVRQITLLRERLTQVEGERNQLAETVQDLRSKVGRLEGELERADAATDKSDEVIKEQRDQISGLQKQILELSKELARMEVRLEMEREKDDD